MKKILIFTMLVSSVLFSKEIRGERFVHVTHSDPVYEYVYDRVYDDNCNDYYYESTYDDRYYDNYSNNRVGLDTLIGATLGVAIGNQIGKGNGRDVARVAGGIIGATVANNNRNHYDKPRRYKKHYKNACRDGRYTTHRVKKLVGYKNYFYFKNRKHFKITKRPRHRIRITTIARF